MSRAAVVLGNGALGAAVVRALGRIEPEVRPPVRVVSRTARAQQQGVEYVSRDLTNAQTVGDVCADAEVVFHCAMPPYHKWTTDFEPLHSAILRGAASARVPLVWGDNMYAYGRTAAPRTEETPYATFTRKGRVRARLADQIWEAHGAGHLQATIVRAADFYGPGARLSTAGDFIFEKLLAGKPAQWLGDPDVPHAFTHIDDFASAMVALSRSEVGWGRTWHAPTLSGLTARDFVAEAARQIGADAGITVPPNAVLRLLGLFNPALRATFEMEYERTEPFLVDSALFETTFRRTPTSLASGISQTLKWYRGEAERAVGRRGAA